MVRMGERLSGGARGATRRWSTHPITRARSDSRAGAPRSRSPAGRSPGGAGRAIEVQAPHALDWALVPGAHRQCVEADGAVPSDEVEFWVE
jgi:hypothetical protein